MDLNEANSHCLKSVMNTYSKDHTRNFYPKNPDEQQSTRLAGETYLFTGEKHLQNSLFCSDNFHLEIILNLNELQKLSYGASIS
jgi:hypothetical protein